MCTPKFIGILSDESNQGLKSRCAFNIYIIFLVGCAIFFFNNKAKKNKNKNKQKLQEEE
jgi:hypothetical protein